MRVPDAWDECGGCGHDRDDHEWLAPMTALRRCVQCDCNGFTEEDAS